MQRFWEKKGVAKQMSTEKIQKIADKIADKLVLELDIKQLERERKRLCEKLDQLDSERNEQMQRIKSRKK